MDKIIRYIDELVHHPSPTGFTASVEEYLLGWAEENNIPAEKSHKGAVTINFPAKKPVTKVPLILAAHVDTLGAMVKKVNSDTVEFVPIGGYPPMYALGNECTIHTDKKTFTGTILPKNPAVHVNRKLADLAPKFEDMAIRVDFLPSDDEDEKKTEKLKDLIQTGDFISFDPEFSLKSGFIKSRHLDDKVSAAILMSLAEELKSKALDRDVLIALNVTEETGQGLPVLPEKADLIIVDMGVVGLDCQGKETHVSICAKDSSGPFNRVLTKDLKNIADEKNIQYVIDIFPYYASDGSGVLSAGNDYRVALIGPGVSASHSWERTHEQGIKASYNLVKAYIGV